MHHSRIKVIAWFACAVAGRRGVNRDKADQHGGR
jgi:hypothetical protein